MLEITIPKDSIEQEPRIKKITDKYLPLMHTAKRSSEYCQACVHMMYEVFEVPLFLQDYRRFLEVMVYLMTNKTHKSGSMLFSAVDVINYIAALKEDEAFSKQFDDYHSPIRETVKSAAEIYEFTWTSDPYKSFLETVCCYMLNSKPLGEPTYAIIFAIMLHEEANNGWHKDTKTS